MAPLALPIDLGIRQSRQSRWSDAAGLPKRQLTRAATLTWRIRFRLGFATSNTGTGLSEANTTLHNLAKPAEPAAELRPSRTFEGSDLAHA